VSHSYQTWFTWLSGNWCLYVWVVWPHDHKVHITNGAKTTIVLFFCVCKACWYFFFYHGFTISITFILEEELVESWRIVLCWGNIFKDIVCTHLKLYFVSILHCIFSQHKIDFKATSISENKTIVNLIHALEGHDPSTSLAN